MVLAGERPGGSDFSRELELPAGVLAEVDGQTALERVIGALRASDCVDGGLLCGPSPGRKTCRRNVFKSA